MSGGKDSYTMAYLLRLFQRKAPVNFEIEVVNIDQGHPGYPGHLLADYMEREGYPFRMVREDTYKIVTEKIPEEKPSVRSARDCDVGFSTASPKSSDARRSPSDITVTTCSKRSS